MSDVCNKCQTPKDRTVCCNKILHCKECNRIRALDYYNSNKKKRQQKTCYIITRIKKQFLESKKNDAIGVKQKKKK